MRYWGSKIEIDGSFYNTAVGKTLLPTAVEMGQLKTAGSYFQFEGNAEFYEETIQNMLREIERNDVGKILIDAINRSGSTVRIIPLTGKEQSQLGRIPCARPVGNYSTTGNSSVIWFEPWSRILNIFSGTGNSPYQVLVHELQHALRQVRGKVLLTGPLGMFSSLPTFPNAEELFSVTIENMYLSAAGQAQRMLAAYNQAAPLGNRSDREWYKQYGGELEVWCRELPDVAALLERVRGIWNPISVRRSVLDFIITL